MYNHYCMWQSKVNCVVLFGIHMYYLLLQLLETYENELSTLKKDLESKAKMLNMYETSMADLSTKVHTLKRSLEEKVATNGFIEKDQLICMYSVSLIITSGPSNKAPDRREAQMERLPL